MITEFAVRYRLPRPIARAYEAVCFAGDKAEAAQRSRWCAATAVRFMAAVRQAFDLSAQPERALNPPSFNDFRDDASPAGKLMMPRPAARLLQVAGIYPGLVGARPEVVLLECLQELDALARCRLAIVEEGGLRVLLGARLEYSCPLEVPPGLAPGAPLYVEPLSGVYVSLTPLGLWRRAAASPWGAFWLLAGLDKALAGYVEAGLPGAPSMSLALAGRPGTGRLKLDSTSRERLRLPRVRFDDGELIGESYHCRGLMWRGGTSEIYAATRLDDGQAVVLKTFEGEGRYDSSYWHFVNEARFGGQVDHPAVIRPRPAGRLACYEQTLAAKGSLEDVIVSNGVLSGSFARRVTLRLLEALAACHAAGVIHNDVKPENILFDDDYELRLIDFGIAAPLTPAGDRLRPGVPPGSAGYMAPEILLGEPPGVASDIFGVGVVLARMLTGVALNEPQACRGRVAEAFWPFLEGCLAARPEARFASAAAAAAVLRAVEYHELPSVTLDIEGTLFDSFEGRHARPGLPDFLSFCLKHFARIFIYTMLSEAQAREMFAAAEQAGGLPAGFMARYEYVAWQGLFKDLRRCGVALSSNVIIDDNENVIPEDQRHLWIRITGYHEVKGYDRGLMLAQDALIRRFDLWDQLSAS